jgi:hypothetical protein
MAREVTRWATNERRVAGHGWRRTVRVRGSTEGRGVVRSGVRDEGSLSERGVAKPGVMWRRWEGVHGGAVARVAELRIVTTRSDKGVCITNSSVGRLRVVHAGVYERNLLHDERDGIRGRNDRAVVRAEVKGIMRRNMWRVGRASFRCHRGRETEKLKNRQR